MTKEKTIRIAVDIGGTFVDAIRLDTQSGQFDLKNHPQNKVPDVRDNPAILNPRPDVGGRNLTWSQASTTWGSTEKYWNLI